VSSGDAEAGAATLGFRLPFGAAASALIGVGIMGMSKISFSTLKAKLPGGQCLIIIGTEGTLLTGVAGSGKTTLLQPLVAAWRADTRYDPGGREVVGLATAWKQARELKGTGIERGFAMTPLLAAIDSGEFQPTRNTVLVIDEVSQIAPRSMLQLLDLQARTGMTIKALGDREQAQAIEAGDTIEIMRRVLPKAAMPELLTTVRQETERGRVIAGLFRGTDLGPEATLEERQKHHLAEVAKALGMKREDGTAIRKRVLGDVQDAEDHRRTFDGPGCSALCLVWHRCVSSFEAIMQV